MSDVAFQNVELKPYGSTQLTRRSVKSLSAPVDVQVTMHEGQRQYIIITTINVQKRHGLRLTVHNIGPRPSRFDLVLK